MTEIKDILKLSVEDRIHLVQTIWDSIATEIGAEDISEEHKNILDERLEEHQKNPNDTLSWDQVKDSIKKHL